MADEIVDGVDVCITRTNDAPAWHKKDVRLACIDGTALRDQRFARPVSSLPAFAEISTGYSANATGYRAIVTDLETEARVVSIVSSRYHAPVDGYGSLVRLIEPLIEKGLLKVVSAGTLRGYARAYMTCELGEGLMQPIVGDDVIKRYWTLTDALDGKHARSSFASDVRIVCANTLAQANRDAAGRKSLRHSAGFEVRSEAWRDMIINQSRLLEEQAESFRRLAQKQIDAAALDAYLRECFEMGDKVEGESVPKRFSFAVERHDNDSARGTLWGAYNSAQATLQWMDRSGATTQARTDAMFFGPAMASNQAFLNAAMARL